MAPTGWPGDSYAVDALVSRLDVCWLDVSILLPSQVMVVVVGIVVVVTVVDVVVVVGFGVVVGGGAVVIAVRVVVVVVVVVVDVVVDVVRPSITRARM